MISCGDGPAKKGVSCAAALNHYEGVVLLEHTCEGEPRDLTGVDIGMPHNAPRMPHSACRPHCGTAW
jgi:hypothetical protein